MNYFFKKEVPPETVFRKKIVITKVSGYTAAETCWYLSLPDVQDNEHCISCTGKRQEIKE